MDARGVQRLLEKIQGLADSAEHVSTRYIEMAAREPRVSSAAKEKLALLYREHAARLMQLYCALGLEIAKIIENEMDDALARGQLDLFRANLATLNERAEQIARESPSS
ncbi:MAG: hypothetical protein HY070_11965 [Chloroflexi bacterium]|nr:hypothetical protein [Chloroflexota bacterium]MBI3742595.1 hypothetical protein [Chloroflexota bacterium]